MAQPPSGTADTPDSNPGSAERDASSVMPGSVRRRLRPGARVRVIQQIAARHYAWGTAHEGVVVRYEQKQTGSWYAHSRGEKLWLDRLVIRKDDGEVFIFNLDEYTHLDLLADAPAEPTQTPDPTTA
jgi:hypothetical protein